MFHSARIKLTAWYLLIIMTISVMFSIIIYRDLSMEISRFERLQRFRIERRLLDQQFQLPFPPLPTANPELLNETRQRILFMLIIVNTGIVLLAGGLGYMLSGITLKPIKDMVDEQNRFISDASHELRTPLTSLKSAFEVFLRGKQQALTDAKTLARESIDEVNKLQTLSESLLALAQYGKPREQHMAEVVSLQEVVFLAVKKMRSLADLKHISFVLKTHEVFVKGDADSFTNCIVILLDNAIKYSKENSKIIITVGKTDGNASISVEDHGIGIDTKDLPFIFNRFYRADSARTKSQTGGYGLGLSIARKIIDIYNGTIGVKSKVHKGSVFIIRLPILSDNIQKPVIH
jgi:two-component system, OmpR family, sensor histidine kinase CiaH